MITELIGRITQTPRRAGRGRTLVSVEPVGSAVKKSGATDTFREATGQRRS